MVSLAIHLFVVGTVIFFFCAFMSSGLSLAQLFFSSVLLCQAGEFSSPGSTFCADSYFGIRSTPVLPQ